MLKSEYIHNTAPLPELLANDLFEFVYVACKRAGCDSVDQCNCGDNDDEFRFTRKFCRTEGLEEGKIIQWLESFGAYCDCALLLNVAIWYMPSSYDPEVDDEGNEIAPDSGGTCRPEAVSQRRLYRAPKADERQQRLPFPGQEARS